MFRKIHSNRDPQDTVLSELKNEFRIYFEKISSMLTQKIEKRPKLIFTVMVTIILFSAGLSFTIFRNKEPADRKVLIKARPNIIRDGFAQISSTAAAIKRVIDLKQQIDSLTAKKQLTQQDSLTLENDLDQLKQLNTPSRP